MKRPAAVSDGASQRVDERVLAEDGRALTRGLVVNALGNAAKLASPVLLAFATRAYGVERWGVFVGLQALVMVVARIGTLGLDKALLWWVASRDSAEADRALTPALLVAGASSFVVAAAVAGFGELALRVWGLDPKSLQSLRVLLLGLPLFGLTEVYLNACMGLRRMEPQVAVRDTLVPLLQVGSAVVLAWFGARDNGLAWSFVLSNGAGLVFAFGAQRRLFKSRPKPESLAFPKPLLRYAIPAGMADLSNALLLRLDTLVLVTLTTPAAVGVWGIVSQFSNAIRQIRRAFDPIVVAVAATIAREHDRSRLVAVISYAAQLVTITQLPVFAFLFAFADLILPLYGVEFGRGATPVLVLCGFWLINGAAGLSGVVLAGYGYAALGLVLVWITLAVQTALLFLLIPAFGLVGAAIAVGLSYSIQNVLQISELRRRIGTFLFSSRSIQPLVPALIASLAAAAVTRALGWDARWSTRIGGFAAFVVVYGGLVFRDYRRGRLAAPGKR